jgi:hypothetical protein
MNVLGEFLYQLGCSCCRVLAYMLIGCLIIVFGAIIYAVIITATKPSSPRCIEQPQLAECLRNYRLANRLLHHSG